jgi:hypothetical protein
MRPRISQKEAAYLVQLLEESSKQLETKQREIKELDLEVYRLKKLLYTETYNVVKQGYRQKLQRLEKAQFADYNLYAHLQLHDILLKKYKAIAEGQPHDGRYKRLSCAGIFWRTKKPIVEVLNY